MNRRKDDAYFERIPGSPASLTFSVKRRVAFSEVDVMGIVWYGRYPLFFEDAAQELGRRCGLSYQDFYEARLRAPIAQFHIDYRQPLYLGEECTIKASLVWCEGAKLLTEYEIRKADDSIATRAYTVQLLIDSGTSEVYTVTPELLERVRRRWLAGEFTCLK